MSRGQDETVTADFLNGKGPQPATLTGTTPDGNTARINLGRRHTADHTATVTPGTGTGLATIAGQHIYTTPGDYTVAVAVTVDDGVKSTVVTTSVHVS